MSRGIWVRYERSNIPVHLETSKEKFISDLMDMACIKLRLPLPLDKYFFCFEKNNIEVDSLVEELWDRTSKTNPAVICIAGKLSGLVFITDKQPLDKFLWKVQDFLTGPNLWTKVNADKQRINRKNI